MGVGAKDGLGLAFMLACGYIFAAVAGVVADALSLSRSAEIPTLPDVLFDALPHVDTRGYFNDKAELGFLAIVVPILFAHGKLQLSARQVYVIQGALWILRAPAFLLTQLPNPYDKCRVAPDLTLGSAWIAGLSVLRGSAHTCSDVMFSGHTAGLTMFLCVACKHVGGGRGGNSRYWTWTRVFLLAYYCLSLVVMVASRFHYSVDVYVGVLVSAGACHIYFQASDAAARGDAADSVTAFLAWYEGDLRGEPGQSRAKRP